MLHRLRSSPHASVATRALALRCSGVCAATAASTVATRLSSSSSSCSSWSGSSSVSAPSPFSSSIATTIAAQRTASLRRQSGGSSTTGAGGGAKSGFPFDADDDELERELKQQAADYASTTAAKAVGSSAAMLAQRLARSADGGAEAVEIDIKRVDKPPAKYEINTTTGVYRWRTTAKYARRVVGPMREWADEFQCRTGVCVQMDPVDADRAQSGAYPSADDVEVNVYLFGSERAVHECVHFLRAMVQTEPSYVRCAVFRRQPAASIASAGSAAPSSPAAAAAADGIEWLTLRRVNPELRPVDIPPISLKTPGKYTLLFESAEEAVIRTVFEETGIELERRTLAKTHVFDKAPVAFYWRPRVEYWIAEVPHDVPVLGPQANTQRYVLQWDPRLLRQSADPIDRTWAAVADPKSGCAWLTGKVIDALQAPVKLETNYMATRYTPAPETLYSDVVKF